MHQVRGQQGAGDEDADEQQRPAQPRVPLRRAPEQVEGPDRRGEHDAREHRARRHVVAPLPQHAAGHADERADRRREGHGVVLVDDPLAEAEHESGDEEPAAPEDERGAHAVGAGARAAPRETGDEQDERGRQQPRDLGAELGAEHAGEAGGTPTPGLTAAPADAAGLVAGEAAEAVVPEDQLEDAVVLRAADVRARRRRPQLDDRDPPAGRREQRTARGRQLPDALGATRPVPRRGTRDRTRAPRGAPAASWPGTRSRRARTPAPTTRCCRARGRGSSRRRRPPGAARAARRGC